MFKFLGKLLGIIAAGIGIYVMYQFIQGEQQVVIEVPEVTFEDVVETAEQAVEIVESVEGDVSDIVEGLEGGDEVPGDEEVVEETEESNVVEGEEGEVEEIPTQFNLAVPFTPQAPHADWALPYQEACEEASAYMVAAYYQGMASGLIDASVADAEILEMVAFQEDFLGFYLDTTAQETVRVIDAFYQYGAQVVTNPSAEQIKAEVAAGRPVIIPSAGQQLGNPFFSGDGPLYHMLVIKGYTENAFIVNDPGTRRGENFVYDIDVMMNAIGDWNGGDPANGAKTVIFTAP